MTNRIILSKAGGRIGQGITRGKFLNPKAPSKLTGTNFTYTETRTINVGEPMGLLLSLTYPETMTFIGTRI